jgi:hypothetical protein
MALILGVDRFMSECRSLTNFIGNAVATVVVSKGKRAGPRQAGCGSGRPGRKRGGVRSRLSAPRPEKSPDLMVRAFFMAFRLPVQPGKYW